MTVTVSHDNADAAFRSLYAEHGPALLRLTTMLTDGDRHRAEDIVQETMLRAWTHRAKLDIQYHSPWAWLITVARHLAIDAHRARQSRPAEAELDDHLALAGGQQPDARLDEVSVRTAIAHLPGGRASPRPNGTGRSCPSSGSATPVELPAWGSGSRCPAA